MHHTREALDRGCIVDGEEFDRMIKEENEEKAVLFYLKEVKELLEEIVALMRKVPIKYEKHIKDS